MENNEIIILFQIVFPAILLLAVTSGSAGLLHPAAHQIIPGYQVVLPIQGPVLEQRLLPDPSGRLFVVVPGPSGPGQRSSVFEHSNNLEQGFSGRSLSVQPSRSDFTSQQIARSRQLQFPGARSGNQLQQQQQGSYDERNNNQNLRNGDFQVRNNLQQFQGARVDNQLSAFQQRANFVPNQFYQPQRDDNFQNRQIAASYQALDVSNQNGFAAPRSDNQLTYGYQPTSTSYQPMAQTRQEFQNQQTLPAARSLSVGVPEFTVNFVSYFLS